MIGIETAQAKFDRLVLDGVLRITNEGYAWFCHVCRTQQPTPPVDALTHDWFDRVVREISEHANTDWDRSQREADNDVT